MSREENVARLRFAGTTARSGGGQRGLFQEAISGGSGRTLARPGRALPRSEPARSFDRAGL